MEHKILRSVRCISLCFIMLLSCNQNTEEVQDISNYNATDTGIFVKDGLTGEIKTCKITKDVIQETIKTGGYMTSPSNSKASVNAPIGGFVKEARFHNGQYVSRGTVLALLEHPSYIKLQQAYLKAKNELAYYKADFTRQGQLTVENAASVKRMQEAEVKYRTTEVDYLSLQAQLRLLGLEPDSVHEDRIVAVIPLKAPISGYITATHATIGKFAADHEALYHLVNRHNMYLRLQVDEKFIDRLQKGLPVHYWRADQPQKKFKARIHTIPRYVDEESGHLSVHAKIAGDNTALVPGMRVEAEIQILSDPVNVLPLNVLKHEGDTTFAYLSKHAKYKRIWLKTGRSDNEKAEIINLADSLHKADFVLLENNCE